MKKLLVDDKITASVKQICLLSFICKVSNRKTLSGEPFAFLKSFATNLKFYVSSNLLFFYELFIDPQPTFLEFIIIFL